MHFPFFSKNGEVLPIEQENIPLSNIEYQYGFGVYENIKVRNGILYFINQHIDRLLKSAEIIGLEHKFAEEEIDKYLKNLIAKLSSEINLSCNLKILLLGGKTAQEAQIFILPLSPLYTDRKLYAQGVKTATVFYERLFPQAKTLNMLGSYLSYKKARENGCYDALLVNSHGNILEGTRTNFFAVKNNTIFTQEEKYILEGVTRQTVLYTARKNGYVIEKWDISLKQIKEGEYDGAFLTSTSAKIIPVKQIDDFVFPEISQSLFRLMKLYDDFLKESRGEFNDKK